MKRSRLLGTVCASVFVLITNTTNAVVMPLESRLGGLAYYDPNLNITWAADANINGSDTWYNQITWVAGLDIGGITNWRLPSADVNGDNTVVDCFGGGVPGCEDNEMGYLYREEGITAATPAPFSNVQSFHYFSGTEYAPDQTRAWFLGFDDGGQNVTGKDGDVFFAWAVHDGDVGPVPIPPSVWLFGSGPAFVKRVVA